MIDGPGTYHGKFSVADLDAWGELKLAGEDSRLRLRVEGMHSEAAAPTEIFGQLNDFSLVSCLECVGGDAGHAWSTTGSASTWSVFPHVVLTGTRHFNPSRDRVSTVWFSTGDIHRVFDDHDAFGRIRGNVDVLQSMIPRHVSTREVPIGSAPQIVYFAGRVVLMEADLPLAKFRVIHLPNERMTAHSVSITSRLTVGLEFKTPTELRHCLGQVSQIGQFLSLIAGRAQSVERLGIAVDGAEPSDLPLTLHWSVAPRSASEDELSQLTWIDMPLDPIRRPDEFRTVIERWFASNERLTARSRLYACLERDHSYSVDRLVAAANMFDLIEVPVATPLNLEVSKILNACALALKVLPKSDDRDAAKAAISRIGQPTLAKKVLARAEVLKGHLSLQSLSEVLRQAILCRNYFVHGPGDTRFNYKVSGNYLILFTETLEFVFAAAELIECGWNARGWQMRHHTSDHWFVRFLKDYDEQTQALLAALAAAKAAKLERS